MKNNKVIGIIGGMGPYADFDLLRKIHDQTVARNDQDHVSVTLISCPQNIEDRTKFLIGQTNVNPAHAIFRMIIKLDEIGVSVIGIPCNTAHAPQIFNVVLEKLKSVNSEIKLLHMINEVAEFIQKYYLALKNIGVLCTNGSYKMRIYSNVLKKKGFNTIVPNVDKQDFVHKAIYDRDYGIKAHSNPATEIAKSKIIDTIRHLNENGADAIILGCTELTAAIPDPKIGKTVIIDPALILARALIREVDTNKLKPLRDF